MDTERKSEIPVNRLSKVSNGRFMLRTRHNGETNFKHPHRDDYYMFGIILSGETTLSIDFKDITIYTHQAIVISPGQVHRPVGEFKADGFILAISPDSLSENDIALLEEYALTTAPFNVDETDFSDILALYTVLNNRVVHTDGNTTDVEFAIASAIKGLFLQNLPIKEATTPNRYKRLVIKLNRLLKDNFINEKRPSAYAHMLNVSGVYLNEAVKNVTGMSVSNYIATFTMLAAKRNLVYTDDSAQEIAYKLGFEDYSYFSRLFRKQSGMSPREFRQKYRE
ncbi:MAG: helix-turn-helix transcriptional regulator [Muribaculaceae bacterium]|nr:helix-turn-helix transcriptional regulator [Muribaculaceae bacterium]